MKLELTKSQIEAIQKLLAAHGEMAMPGSIPDHNVCYNAYLRIEEQTGITKITEKDLQRSKAALRKVIVPISPSGGARG